MWHVVDMNGYLWVYDGDRIFCVEAELELKDQYLKNPTENNKNEFEENGYGACSWENALEILKEGGYIE